jgi:hypothetical protein
MGRFVAVTLSLLAAIFATPTLAAELHEPALPGFSHRAYTGGEIVPADRVFRILQTPDGYLWLGTEGGVVRYDGTHAERVLPAPPGAEDYLMMSDPEGAVWISRAQTQKNELLRFKDGKAVVVPLGPLQPGESAARRIVYSTMRSKSGDVWAGLFFGGVLRIQANGNIERFGTSAGLPRDDGVTAILEVGGDGHGPRRVVAGTATSGVYELDGQTFHPVRGPSGALAHIRSLYEARDGAIWAATEGGILRIHDKNGTFVAENANIAASKAEDLLVATERSGSAQTDWVCSAMQMEI